MKWTIALLAILPAFLPAAEPSLLLPANEKPLRLQLTIHVNGQQPDKAHDAFLDRLFDFYNRDGNEVLSAVEAKRLFTLPGADGRGIALDHAKLGKGTRAEFKDFYRQTGFTPIVPIFAPAGAEMTRANAALFKRFDRDGDNKLSRAELGMAQAVLRAFDADEDEILTLAELLIDTPATDEQKPAAASVAWSTTAMQPADGVLAVELGDKPETKLAGKPFEVVGDEARYPGGILRTRVVTANLSARLAASREFYLTPFQSALGDKAFLTTKAIEDDSSLAFLTPLAPHADRDGDGKLTRAELNTFLDLIEAGVRSQAVVRIVDEGASLFAALDENRDGRLDLRELSRAARLLTKDGEALQQSAIPRRLTVEFELGSPGKTFGPMLIVGKSKTGPVAAKKPPTGPKWFHAMDRNSDGLLSPREFLGPPEAFAKLDADGDGFITSMEAERAKP